MTARGHGLELAPVERRVPVVGAVEEVGVFVGTVVFDLLLGDVHSLKHKRAVVRPLLASLKRLDVSAAETGHLDLHRRAEVSVAVVAADAAHVERVLDTAERSVVDDPEVQVLSAHRQLRSDSDD